MSRYAKSLLEAVSFKKDTEGMGRGRVANARWERDPHSGAATLKPREANVVRTRGKDSSLQSIENVWGCVAGGSAGNELP